MGRKIIVGITGASGAILGIRLMELLGELKVETHLIVSEWGKRTIEYETGYDIEYVQNIANRCYDNYDMSAPVSSGSFENDGMVIIPSSMKTLSAVASGYSDSLITRAADVALKERRRLILVPRETPLNSIHLKNMITISQAGGVVMPFMPSFYNRQDTLAQIADQFLYRLISLFGIRDDSLIEWQGPGDSNVNKF